MWVPTVDICPTVFLGSQQLQPTSWDHFRSVRVTAHLLGSTRSSLSFSVFPSNRSVSLESLRSGDPPLLFTALLLGLFIETNYFSFCWPQALT